MDENIKSYHSQVLLNNKITLNDYFSKLARHEVEKTLPQDAIVVEIKTPTNIFILADKKKSTTHRKLQKLLFHPIMNNFHTYPGFKRNKGKRHHMFSEKIAENKL